MVVGLGKVIGKGLGVNRHPVLISQSNAGIINVYNTVSEPT